MLLRTWHLVGILVQQLLELLLIFVKNFLISLFSSISQQISAVAARFCTLKLKSESTTVLLQLIMQLLSVLRGLFVMWFITGNNKLV